MTEEIPLCLTFQARERVEVVDGRETPPSRVLSEGGGGGGVLTEETPPASCVWSEGGVVVMSTEGTPLSRISSERRGGGAMNRHNDTAQHVRKKRHKDKYHSPTPR